MPRQGNGQSDNAIEAEHNITHGTGNDNDAPLKRVDKVATPPPEQKGAGIQVHGERDTKSVERPIGSGKGSLEK
ncbi:hypothetical protein ABW19_dt0203508 [Dactylella cylindrospora]|nr:hypothetical protein ABW19_dt0203508 [Dactylella cylindrospora]